jgi:hypothetical protein
MLITSNLFSQNFIRNSSFEDRFNCPNYMNYELGDNLYFWRSTGTSSLYYNICTNDTIEPYWLANSLPFSGFGYQYPKTGDGMIGLYALGYSRGLAAITLKSNLEIGKKYWVEYYTNLGDSANYAVRAMGATFEMETINMESTSFPLYNRNFKLENTGSYLEDKIRWTQLKWIFEADSAYQDFLIGYARNLQNLDTIFVGSDCYWCENFFGENNKFSFYFIDNVGVYPIISNNQTFQPCTFPQVLQGPLGNDIWFREWKKDTTVLSANINQTINQAGTYTLTWRTDTTVHIDTFWVEASVPVSNFLGQDIAWQSGNSITLTAPNGFSYLWNTGSNTQNIVVDTTGIFSVVVTNTFDCAYTDSVVVFNPLGLEEVLDKLEVEIYPNPAKGNINIKSTEPNCTIEIYASDGKMVLHHKLVNSPTINVTEWQQGIYYLKFYSERGTKIPVVRKMVVQK